MKLKEKWAEFKRQTTCKKVVCSVIFSFLLLFFSYVICNTSIPLPDEMGVLQGWDKFKSINGFNKDSIPNDVLLVNVSYDKALTDYEKNGIPVGQYAITDRKKIYDFLLIAKKANNYKYILLDIIFEKGIASIQDSMLFSLIASMERIVIPVHKDIPLQDDILYSKAANADYTVTWKETNFARFRYRWNDIPTVPLKMYQDINGKDISGHGFIYTSGHWLCKNGVTLQLPIRLMKDMKSDGEKLKVQELQLGADLLASDSIAPIADEIKDKIVVLGDLDSDSDLHDTYAGPLPGSLISLNAYYALLRGDHIILGKYGLRLIFYMLVAVIYVITMLFYLNSITMSFFTDIMWIKVVISYGGVGLLYWTIAIIGYLFFDTVFNFWIPIMAFSVLGTFIYIHSLIKETKHAKKTHSITTKSAGDDSNGGQLQDPLSE